MLQIRDTQPPTLLGPGKAVGRAARFLPAAPFLRYFPNALRPATLRRLGALRLSFLACVILPVLIALTYLAGFASKQYVSEAKFAVRRAVETKMPAILEGLPAALSTLGGGASSTIQDAFIVTDYIRSRTIIEDLGGKDVLHAIYSRPEADWWSRLGNSLPLEKVWKYWRNRVTPRIDTQSGIVTVEVMAYSAEDARRLAEMIVQRSETLINEISERSRRDALLRAEKEVTLAQERLRKAREALLVFRNQNSAIDPVANATSLTSTVAELMSDKIKLENDRASLVGIVSAESPVKRQLDARIGDLNAQIARLRNELTSQKSGTAISGQIAGYEGLQLETQFTEKLYSVAQSAYEQARAEQDKQQLYLAAIVKPTTPEEAYYPRILATTSVVFTVCFVFWSMFALLFASIRDHMGG